MIRLFVWCIFFDCYAVTFAGSRPYFLGRSDRLGYREGRGSSLTGVMLVNAPLDLCRQVKNEQQAKLGDTWTASEPDSTTVTLVIMTLGCRGFLPLRAPEGWWLRRYWSKWDTATDVYLCVDVSPQMEPSQFIPDWIWKEFRRQTRPHFRWGARGLSLRWCLASHLHPCI